MFRHIKSVAARVLGWFRSSATPVSVSAPTEVSPAKRVPEVVVSKPRATGRSLTHQPAPTASPPGTGRAAAWSLSDALLSPHVLAQGYICQYVQPVTETGAVYVITVLLDGKLIVRGQFPTERNLVRSAMGN